MIETFRTFLRDPTPSRRVAGGGLRLVYAVSFLAQLVSAMVVAGVMSLLVRRAPMVHPEVVRALLLLCLLPPLILFLLTRPLARTAGKRPALFVAILAGTLLSTPVWYVALAWLLGAPAVYGVAFVVVLASFYGGGLLLTGRLVRWVVPAEENFPSSAGA